MSNTTQLKALHAHVSGIPLLREGPGLAPALGGHSLRALLSGATSATLHVHVVERDGKEVGK